MLRRLLSWTFCCCFSFLCFSSSTALTHTINKIYDSYFEWLRGHSSTRVARKRSALKKLIAHAGISNPSLPTVEPMGWGQLASFKIDVLENFPSNRKDITQVTCRVIQDALGVYKDRMWSVINPLSWIQIFVFLPQSIIGYLGLSTDTVLTKLLQLIWWALCSVFALAKVFYADKINQIIATILHIISQWQMDLQSKQQALNNLVYSLSPFSVR